MTVQWIRFAPGQVRTMHIISASRRTDIPAWYGPWFMNRIKAGEASYRNPFGGQIHTVSLRPENVIALVFWTKNAGPFLNDLKALIDLGYKACFQYTVTGYGSLLEEAIPPWKTGINSFRALSDLLGPQAVRWRYDPILLSQRFNRDYHLRHFSSLARALEGHTRTCHVSFVQFYQKTKRAFARLEAESGERFEDPIDEDKVALAEVLREIARARKIELVSCCYPLLETADVAPGRCVDPALIRLLRPDLPLKLKALPTRKGCGCVESRDIGSYNSCPGACQYCYATQNPDKAREKHKHHDPLRDTLP